MNKTSLVLEVADRSRFALPANHKDVYGWIISRLIANDSAAPTVAHDQAAAVLNLDAYGNAAEFLDDKLPEVKLNVLGKVKLRAMNKESPCQFRYGFAESTSFPVGRITRDLMQKSLEWIGQPERRGKTWSDVKSLGGMSSILFAYPSEKPETAPELAGLIVGVQDDADPDGGIDSRRALTRHNKPHDSGS